MREILFRGKRKDDGEWIEGLPSYDMNGNLEEMEVYRGFCNCNVYEVDSTTVGQYTGLADKHGRKIFEGDIVKLILPDEEIRYFKVSIRSVVRKVLSHQDFNDKFPKVEITGVVFEWNGYELFPCVETYGMPDYKMMEVIGNIFDNPELITGHP